MSKEEIKMNYSIIIQPPSGKYIDIKSIREKLSEFHKEQEITYKELVSLFLRFSK